MPNIYSFRPIVPKDNQQAESIVSLPYDVFSYEEAKAHIQKQPDSILTITRSDAFFPEEEAYEQKVYERAQQNMHRLLERKVISQESEEGMFIYAQTWNGSTQTGLVCLSDLEDYEKKRIKKHEQTRPDKEKDRTDHMRVLQAQTGNVFLLYKHSPKLHSILQRNQTQANQRFVVHVGGVKHSIWKISSPEDIAAIKHIFSHEIDAIYIADGHHRAASAYRLYQEDKTKNKFLTTIFSDREIRILPYNRLVKNINQHSQAAICAAIEKQGYEIAPMPYTENQLSFYMGKKWYALRHKHPERLATTLERLQASYLQKDILSSIFSVHDPRKDKHIAFVGGIHGNARLESLVDSQAFDIAFALAPVQASELIAVADADEMMPPKSTWFEPKLLDGFFIHAL